MMIKLFTPKVSVLVAATGWALMMIAQVSADDSGSLDGQLQVALARHGFTGRIESTLETRLGRRIDHQLADLGRLLWFDTITGLNNDNTAPAAIHR